MTRLLLWERHQAGNPDGYSYTRYSELLQAWRGLQSRSMRQTPLTKHRASDRGDRGTVAS